MTASNTSFGWGYDCGEPSIEQSLYRKVDIVTSVVRANQCMECLESATENVVHKSGRCEAIVNSAFSSDVCSDICFEAVAVCVYVC